MTLHPFTWPAREEFLNRRDELTAIERWWSSGDQRLLAIYGRRRVGKSWLFRAFAHSKPAVILVAERGAPGAQLGKLAAALEEPLGVRPDLEDVPALFRVLYRIARDEKTLIVIDEFPHLLPASEQKREALLSAIQAVIEEAQDASEAKIVLCGSHISQMEKLLEQESPIHGRLYRFFVGPLAPDDCKEFIEADDARDWIERYSVSGGMPRYLSDLGRGASLKHLLCSHVLDRHGALFEEPPYVLQQELRRPGTYLSVLEQLAEHPKSVDDLTQAIGETSQALGEYLRKLREMRIVDRELPVTAPPGAKGYRYRLIDGFFRFWFRFVRPYKDQLETGLSPADLWEAEVKPGLADHIAPAFEELCRRWVRTNLGQEASQVGSWWGSALDDYRRNGERLTEEIDIVGLRRRRVSIVGECKWTNKPLSVKILKEIEEFKLPAMRQDGAKTGGGGPRIVLFSRSGYTDGLKGAAEQDSRLLLVNLDESIP